MEKGIYISTTIILLLILLGLLISFFIGILLVPLTSTPRKNRKEILEAMNLNKNDMLLDLGSGNGTFLIEAAKKYNVKGIGYEISPLGIFLSRTFKLFNLKIRKNIAIVPNSFLNNAPLPQANKIYCYLRPKAMQTVLDKLLKEELDKETTVYSYHHPFPNVKEKKKLKLTDNSNLYIYKGSSFNK